MIHAALVPATPPRYIPGMDTPRPAERFTGRDLLRAIDRRRAEDADKRNFALGLPPRAWWLDPRYG